MRVLVECEVFGVVRDAFLRRGHDAWSSDIREDKSGRPDRHIVGDARDVIRRPGWDLMIAFPPCTYLCASGLHWNRRRPGRDAKTDAALAFAFDLMAADIPRIAIENPVGRLGVIWKAHQIIQPYEFGEDASKKTALWLQWLPLLVPTKYIAPRIVDGLPRWANQTDSGQNRLSPSDTRSDDRAMTYRGIADAMADQWGVF